MFRVRSEHLGTEKAAGAGFGVDVQQPLVAKEDARPALVRERHRADDVRPMLDVAIATADDRDLRIGEDDAERRAALRLPHVRKARRIVAGDPALVGRFVQHRNVVVDVAGDEDRRRAALERLAIEQRNRVRVPFERRVLEAELPDVRGATGRGQQVLEALDLLGAVERTVGDDHRVAVEADVGMRVGVEIELGTEDAPCLGKDRRVADRADAAAAAEHLDADAEPVQRLPEFESDDTGTEHRDAFRQVGELEDLVIRDQALAERRPDRRIARRRAGRDHDRLRVDRRGAIDRQRVVVDERGVAEELVGFRNLVDAAGDEADEAVAFALHPRHHRLAVDDERGIDREAEVRELRNRVRGLGRRDQQLARHAADACAGRAVDGALDQQRALAGGLRRAIGGEPGGAGADDGDVGLETVHGSFPNAFVTSATTRFEPPRDRRPVRPPSSDSSRGRRPSRSAHR